MKKVSVLLVLVFAMFLACTAFAALSQDQAFNDLMAGNIRFVADKPETQPVNTEKRTELLKGQHPFATILTCSDSRVPPEHVFNQGLGDLFVIRNAGNVIDTSVLGTIEYGVEHLHTPVLMILGHQNCGAVKATIDSHGKAEGNIGEMLKKIEPSVLKVQSVLKVRKEAEQKENTLDLCIKENVHNSAREILSKSPIVKELFHTKKLRIILAYYHLDTGKVDIIEELKAKETH